MKTQNVMKISAITLGVLMLSLSFAGVTSANNDPRRQYLIGTGFLCTPPLSTIFPTGCPAKASASNGDVVWLAGSGMFTANPSGKATGGGTFIHWSSTGTVKAFGTWTAVELVSFTQGGFSTASGLLPPGSNGGIAVLKVHITPSTGGAGLTGFLTIKCHDGTPTVHEGVALDVVGLINFDTSVSGINIFIQP